ncbi:Ribonuclease kappa [Cyphomyrmex costatus]|uniref:Ribonuclease kappa n=2 Tax=Cyphomyrmex costatus TaxID=456900 RepID=A0A195CN78_9HYME|nr:Ribonuclease kappa [Cyphomyrmex costatus]
MGVFFYVRSVALVEDLPLKELKETTTTDEFYKLVDRGYTQNAYNCWIAVCIYVLTFLFSGHQFYLNSRSSLSV